MSTHTIEPAPYAEWEKAEVARSGVEASLTDPKTLRISAGVKQRYLNPPADTPYPLEYAYHLLGDVRGKQVLDLGCGNGANTALLALRGATVWALDLSPELVELGRRRLAVNAIQGDVRFIVGSAHAIDLPDSSIDVVFGIAILHHLDLAKVAAETHRILKPGGRAVFQEPVRNSRVIRAIRALIPYRAPDVSPYERPLTNGELAEFARPFRALRIRAFFLPHVAVGNFVPPFSRDPSMLYRIDAAILARFPALAHFAGIRVFEVTK